MCCNLFVKTYIATNIFLYCTIFDNVPMCITKHYFACILHQYVATYTQKHCFTGHNYVDLTLLKCIVQTMQWVTLELGVASIHTLLS